MRRAVLAMVALALALPTSAFATDRHATPSTFASTFAAAQGGDTILLASGSYGTWSGGSKPSTVTLRPETGATPTINLNFTGSVTNLTIDGVTVTGSYLASSVRNITVSNATMTGPTEVAPGSTPLNVVFDNDRWGNIGHSIHEGRLSITGGSGPSGVQVKNSFFGPGGCSDGIQISSAGVEVGPGNEFTGINQGNCTEHVDPLQLYGGDTANIHDNWFHGNDQGIMAPDGSTGTIIKNNVIVSTYNYDMVLGDFDNGTIVHNVADADIYDGNPTSQPGCGSRKSTNDIFRDNVGTLSGCGTNLTADHNVGSVTFTGGTGRCQFATASPTGTASDGTDIGLNSCGASPPPDTTPPDTSITSGPADPSTSTSASLTYAATETGSTFECKLDSGSFASCTAPKSYSGLSVGTHTFSVRATDAAGNTDASPASWTWTINSTADTTPPDTSITSGPATPTTSTSASFAFTSTEAGSTFECKLDSGTYASCTSPKAYSGLSVGSHTFSVRATDAAANTDASPATQTWTIDAPADTTPPDTWINSGPATTTTSTSASFGFSSTEAGSTFQCKLDSGSYASCTSPKGYSGLSVGSHTFSVRATDAAANTDVSPATQTWTINAPADTTPPETTISSGPTGATRDTTPTFAFTSSEPGSTFACRVDSGAWSSCTSPWTTPELADGGHSVGVRATDGAGNTDASPAARTFTVRTAAPHTKITSSPAALSLSGGGSVAFTVDESDATSECRLDEGAWAGCTSPYELSGLGTGGHTVEVRSTDAVGNVEAPAQSASWTVVAPVTPPTPPTPTPTPIPTVPAGPTVTLVAPKADATVTSSIRFRANVTASNGMKRVEFWVDGRRVATDSRAPYASQVTVSGLHSGTHTVTARAFDTAGQAASSAALVRVSRKGASAKAAVLSAARGAQLTTAAAGDDATRLAGAAPKQRMVRATLTLCDDRKGAVADRASLRADSQGRLDAMRSQAGLCVLKLALAS